VPELEPLGILSVDAMHYYVHDVERMRRFLVGKLDFAEVGASIDPDGDEQVLFQAGEVRIVVTTPRTPKSPAARWLRAHPEGVGNLSFTVRDADRAFALLDERGGTFLDDVRTLTTPDGGTFKHFGITTPFGDVTWQFVERHDTDAPFPSFAAHETPRGGTNRWGLARIDHITSNFQTMRPMLLWMEHVMGFKVYWDVAFHTADLDPDQTSGSGLKSVVVWDPESQVKFANNEPCKPFFRESQINVFTDDLRGDGIQHAAFEVGDILATVRGLRAAGVGFMPTPDAYYDMLPARIQQLGIGAIEEDIEVLRDLEILVDGEGDRSYMLQIFLDEQAGHFEDKEAGPFFVEIIQRKGDRGFGAGNFRALFESIERQQRADGRV
jgi:4-hydroxyphenylpyruvate dioxygenase